MLNIILTRSKFENERIISENKLLHINYISWPQLQFIDLKVDFAAINNASIVVTSKFAAQIVAKNYRYKFDCYVVGNESATILKTNKLSQNLFIYDTVDELYNFISRTNLEQPIYLSGNIVTKDLNIKNVVIYNTIYNDQIDADTTKLIRDHGIFAILIYSYRTASNILKILNKENLMHYLQETYIITLSEKISALFSNSNSKLLFCNKPNEQEMMTLLANSIYAKK